MRAGCGITRARHMIRAKVTAELQTVLLGFYQKTLLIALHLTGGHAKIFISINR